MRTGLIIASCVIAFWFSIIAAFSAGYYKGKKMLLAILRAHLDRGMNASAAIQYEEDVLAARVPRP